MSIFDWLPGRRKPNRVSSVPISTPPDDNSEASLNQFDAAKMGPKRPLLYTFQYVVLPEAVFENHPELIREFEGKGSFFPLLHFRSKAYFRCVEAGLFECNPPTEADEKAEAELFKALAVHAHRRDGYTVRVVTMPTPESPPEAHFVGIVQKDGEPKEYGCPSPSTRYFTLESSHTQRPVLCEVRQDGSRRNYGEGPAPDRAAFVEAVFERLTAGQPGSNRVLLEGGSAAVMMFAPRSSTDYHLVCVEFEDGTRLSDAKVYNLCELELPAEFNGKKIMRLAINARQP